MKASDEIKDKINSLSARQRQLCAEQEKLKATIESESAEQTVLILAGEDVSAIAESLARHTARLAACDLATKEAQIKIGDLKQAAADAADQEALEEFSQSYPDLCRELTEADEQLRAVQITLDGISRKFAEHSAKLSGPRSRVAKSTAGFCYNSLIAANRFLMSVGTYFDAMHEVQEKRMEQTQ